MYDHNLLIRTLSDDFLNDFHNRKSNCTEDMYIEESVQIFCVLSACFDRKTPDRIRRNSLGGFPNGFDG